ncbi:MAG: hypothetical protein ABNH26_08110 [Celeribacter sp.]|jgi:quinol monooxygenase YgiN
MSLQLLCRYQPTDRDTWRQVFDGDAETRDRAGLSLLQLWNETEGSGVWCLFEVADRDRAQNWLDGPQYRQALAQAGVSADSARFVRTA